MLTLVPCVAIDAFQALDNLAAFLAVASMVQLADQLRRPGDADL